MKIESLIDSRNEKLYHSVKNHFNLMLEENQDWRAECWTSSICDNTVIIKHCPTVFPNAEFARELLRIDTQIKGFKEILCGVSINKNVQEILPTIITKLNLDFQQHKMAKKILALGYPPEQIYDYDRNSTFDFLKEQLKDNGRSIPSLSILYLSFISPFLNINDEKKDYIRREFDDYGEGRYKQIFDNIDDIMNKWTVDESYEAESFRISFLKIAGVTDTWFSYKHDLPGMYEHEFPTCGFFVDNSFTLDDIKNVYGF